MNDLPAVLALALMPALRALHGRTGFAGAQRSSWPDSPDPMEGALESGETTDDEILVAHRRTTGRWRTVLRWCC